MLTDDELRAMRMRNEVWADYGGDAPMAPSDRAKLIEEVDRLHTEIVESRAAYDALCREVAAMWADQ